MAAKTIKFGPENSTIKDGFSEIYFESWIKFAEHLNTQMLDQNSCIWRGHREQAWKLETTFERSFKNNSTKRTIQEQFERFYFACNGKVPVGTLRQLSDYKELYAIGQHYGLHTPLLDWTESPYVAAFFAFADKDETKGKNEFRAVFCLRKKHVEIMEEARIEEAKSNPPNNINALALLAHTSLKENQLSFYRPEISDNTRLISQSGLFSLSISSVEHWFTANASGEDQIAYLQKLLIPESERPLALKALNRMNINYSTLFPDLEGASKHTNLYMEIDIY